MPLGDLMELGLPCLGDLMEVELPCLGDLIELGLPCLGDLMELGLPLGRELEDDLDDCLRGLGILSDCGLVEDVASEESWRAYGCGRLLYSRGCVSIPVPFICSGIS